ncbi:alanine--glyoxylate aminotransferase family protein [Candidatus Parvarchaeota archaeon]|nr:alanine--glyoxylate aminotransferase family protein [Candidatus Parvarchaeota archaeon]
MLLTPGPVKLTDQIRTAQAKEMISHRGKDFEALYSDLVGRFKKYAGATDAFIMTGSGSLGIEAIILNCVKKEEKMLIIQNGDFGRRFADVARIYTNVMEDKVELGKGIGVEHAKRLIDESNAQVFGMVYNETSVGVANQAKEIFNYAKSKGMYTVMDAVSAWAGMELDMNSFGVDFMATGSQKAIGCSPGISMVGISKAGYERYESKNNPSYYSDFKTWRKFGLKNQTPWTPAVSPMFSLQAGFDRLDKDGGLEANIKRHSFAAQYSREWIVRSGFQVFAQPGFYSNTISSFLHPRADEVKSTLKAKYGIEIAGGFGELKGKLLRICHIGNFTIDELDLTFAALDSLFAKIK